MKKEISFEEYRGYLNDWEDPDKPGQGKYVYRVPKGKRLVMSSKGRYYLVDKVDGSVAKIKGKK